MCGIAGIFHLDGTPVSSVAIRKMTDVLRHRGPDGEGIYTDRCVAIGHRRLAIIDLSSASAQPMETGDGRFVISFNGEIYNFRELKTELAALGVRFHSQGDAEVLLKAYQQWGTDAFLRFNGMFACLIWDREKQELLIARDRYGIKPLYYTLQGTTLLVGSEVKAILAHPAYRTEIDLEALLEYFTFQNYLTHKTLFKGISLLPAGSYLKIHKGMQTLSSPIVYWDFYFREPKIVRSEEDYIEELQRLFQQAVSRQLVSDVELGAYLSGGMDSGSLTAVAAAQLPDLKSFTVGFDLSSASGLELGFDERKSAEHMSYLFKTEHYQMVLKAGDMERVMPKLAYHIEEPRVGQSYPNFYAAQLASKFVKVVLAGAGGDELFGGYPWRYYRAIGSTSFEQFIDLYYLFWQRLIPNSQIQQVFKPVWKEVKHVWTRDLFRNVFVTHENELRTPEDYINHSLYFEAKTFLHGLLLVDDKVSMAHGLETRVPFLDNDLVDFAMNLPVKTKLSKLAEMVRMNENDAAKTTKYYQQTGDGKSILRKAMTKYIPSSITSAAKQGFSAPDAAWFKGESIDYVRKKLFADDVRIYSILDRESVQSLINEHLSGQQNRRLLIWSLINVEKWCQHYL